MLLTMLSDQDQHELEEKIAELKKKDRVFSEQSNLGKEPKSHLPEVFKFSHLGLEFAIIFLAFFFLGQYLDKLWQIDPWLTIAGTFLGFIAAFVRILALVKTFE